MSQITTEPEAKRLLALKDEIVQRWIQLPPEHQATMLLVLLDRSVWAMWSVGAWLIYRRKGEDRRERNPGCGRCD